ncbi:type I-PGING CRISPR-associated protein Cas5p [Marinilabiliaceae bacterium ANBcel2]|nr:type I-PGING CRISPR-associated protein Cas5p [Marinilabiliaceae bacterium ANBcel2]
MKNIDLTILKKKPELDTRAKVIIEPLAPLSMVSDLPGSFYKSLRSPNKKMLCGLFENLIGWHIDIADRTKIQKDLIKHRKKQKIGYNKPQSGSTYIPLLYEYFDIEMITVPPAIHYNDLWSRAYRRADTIKHLGGTRFMDGYFIKPWDKLTSEIENNKEISSKEKTNQLDKSFKEHIGKFATFYSSPTPREYIIPNEPIEINLTIDPKLLHTIKESILINNNMYMGNSEGWINLKVKEYEK